MYVNYCSDAPKTFKTKFGTMPSRNQKQHLKMPAMNVSEKEGALILEFALPGIPKEDIKIQIEGNVLHLNAKNSQTEKETYMRCEFTNTEFNRKIRLPDDVEIDQIDAQYHQGILKLQLGRKAKRQNTISVK